jgi:hypothetical protein
MRALDIYTVHVKPGDSPLHAVYVPEGFSFWAFIFQPLWALYHRLWLVALLMLGASVLLDVMTSAMGLSFMAATVLQLLLAFVIGAEARDLWRWTLRRRGYEMRAALAAADKDEAELRFFGTTRTV